MSIMDAYIGSFDAKFFYNHWRPYTAIRWAAHDGNPRTEPDRTGTTCTGTPTHFLPIRRHMAPPARRP